MNAGAGVRELENPSRLRHDRPCDGHSLSVQLGPNASRTRQLNNMLHSFGTAAIVVANSDFGDILSNTVAGLMFMVAVLFIVVLSVVITSGAVILIQLVCTIVFLCEGKYRQKGPGILNRVLSIPGIVVPAIALSLMFNEGIYALDGIPLITFLLTGAALLLIWFGPWIQYVRAVSRDLKISSGEALRDVLQKNRLRFCLTIGLPLLLITWVSAANIF